MSRRLSVFAIVIVLLFAAIAAQAVNIQFFRAPGLNASILNPRNSQSNTQYPRGEIVAADGTVLAKSVPATKGYYPYTRVYPLGALTSGLVGFASPFYGTWALEAQYNQYLIAHAQPPQSLAQVLAPTSAADSISITLQPSLQRVAAKALAGRNGAAVVLDPRTGAVLAMYANPTYHPAPFESSSYTVAAKAWKLDTTNNAYGFPPLGDLAIQQTFPPGSTFKIVTTSAVVAKKPSLFTKSYPVAATIHLPDSNKTLSNYAFVPCGGDIAQMLPPSCDQGYALIGLDLGGNILAETADSYGFNSVPPIDLPGAQPSYFPSAASFVYNKPGLAYSAIGQQNVRATALQMALVAAAIANGGTIMAPHLLNYVSGPDGSIVKRYQDTPWKSPLTKAQAAQIVPLMQAVAHAANGTAAGVFPAWADAGAKTGTAQVGNAAQNVDDWMIAFAPATNPTVAVAVVVPYQITSTTGNSVAGPIMRCMVEGALSLQAGLPVSGTATTCP